MYTDVIVGFVRSPLARAANWFNQNVLDGIVNGTATVFKRTAGHLHRARPTGRGRRGPGFGHRCLETGGLLRRMQNGRVQGYAALMFAAAAVLAGVFVLAV
ncbi:MAG: hypothetical protein R2749_02510 [Acidimicrobiales bacterium]